MSLQPRLPESVQLRIIAHVPEKAAKIFRACSLTCRAWREPSQRLLHKWVWIQAPGAQMPLDAAKPLSLDRYSDPRVASYVTEINLEGFDFSIYTPPTAQHVEVTGDDIAFRLLERFPNLRLVKFDDCMRIERPNGDISALERVFRNVERMNVSDSDSSNFIGFFSFLFSFPRLSVLELTRVAWYDNEHPDLQEFMLSQDSFALVTHLEELRFCNAVADDHCPVLFDIRGWLSVIPHVQFHPNFRLVFGYAKAFEGRYLPALLKALGPALKRLHLRDMPKPLRVFNFPHLLIFNTSLREIAITIDRKRNGPEWVRYVLSQVAPTACIRKLVFKCDVYDKNALQAWTRGGIDLPEPELEGSLPFLQLNGLLSVPQYSRLEEVVINYHWPDELPEDNREAMEWMEECLLEDLEEDLPNLCSNVKVTLKRRTKLITQVDDD